MRDDEASYALFETASSPMEAELIKALLEAAGIPAHVEGGSLADEFAISQRLMGTQGVRVFVPRDLLERAREVRSDTRVSDAELERQALESADEESDDSI